MAEQGTGAAMTKWLTQSEYARRHGVSREAVHQAIHAGRLATNGKSGRECRVDATVDIAATRKQEPSTELTLVDARLRKLQVDIEFQRQKIAANRRDMMREVSELMLEEFCKSFAPLKKQLTSLRLSREQIAEFRKLVSECLTSFDNAVKERMNELRN